jgi:hypothetical protein
MNVWYQQHRVTVVRVVSVQSVAICSLWCGIIDAGQVGLLAPLLLIFYTADLIVLIQRHGLAPHMYADATQAYGFNRPTDADGLLERLHVCIDEVARWMGSNHLQLKANKSDLL